MKQRRAVVVFREIKGDPDWNVRGIAEELRKLFGVFRCEDFGMFVNSSGGNVIVEGPEVEIGMLGSYFKDGVLPEQNVMIE